MRATEIVNHHKLSDFHQSQKEALRTLFAEVLELPDEKGLRGLDMVMDDGAKMRAVACKQPFRRKQLIGERLAAAKELVKEMDKR